MYGEESTFLRSCLSIGSSFPDFIFTMNLLRDGLSIVVNDRLFSDFLKISFEKIIHAWNIVRVYVGFFDQKEELYVMKSNILKK